MFDLINKIIKSQPVATENNAAGVLSSGSIMGKSPQITKTDNVWRNIFRKSVDSIVPIDSDGKPLATGMDSLSGGSGLKLRSDFNGLVPDQQLAWFVGQGFIGHQIAAYIAQNWLVAKACSMPGKDAVRNWFELTVNDGTEVALEIFAYINKMNKHFKLKANLKEFSNFNRVFGIRIAMPIVESDDPDFYTKPFNIDGVKAGSYKGISQIDPYWVAPEMGASAIGNPAAIDFYEPTWWRIDGKLVHRTHLVIIRYMEVADVLKPTYLFGGIPLPQLIAERVYAAEQTANEAPMLAMTKRMTTLTLDLDQAAANPETFESRMRVWTDFRDNYGVKIVGLKENLQQFDTGLADLDALIMTQYQLVASIAGVPATKLLGTSPKGFNATGEYEAEGYHEELETIQEHDLTPLVDRHLLLLMRSHVMPKFNLQKPIEFEVNWLPVSSLSADQQADINLKKSQTDQNYAAMGAIDGTDVRAKIVADKDSGYNGLVLEAPEESDELLDEAAQTNA